MYHDNFLDATLHDIRVGRYLGDDFVSMPFIVDGFSDMGLDGEAAAMSLGLITEIAMPLTPAGAPGSAVKGVAKTGKATAVVSKVGGKGVELVGKGLGKVPVVGKAGEFVETVGKGTQTAGRKLATASGKLDKVGDAMLPENVIGVSARYYRLAQEERALKDAGLKGTLKVDEAAAPRAARDFIRTTTDDAGRTSDDLIPQARTPDGERMISEATTGAKQIDEFAEQAQRAPDYFDLPEETALAMSAWVRNNKEASKIIGAQTADDLYYTLRFGNVDEVKEATLIPTMRSYLANKVPDNWLFITPTMLGKVDKWKEIAGDVNEKMARFSDNFIEELPGGKFRYLEEPFDSKTNLALGS